MALKDENKCEYFRESPVNDVYSIIKDTD